MVYPLVSITFTEPQPYCQMPDTPLDRVTSWVVYAQGFGFVVAGYGRTKGEAMRACAVYVKELKRSVTYRVWRRRLWQERG